jgi:flagellin
MVSIHSGLSALISLHSLSHVHNDLLVSQKRVSTGFNVADAFDNGAIFAIAQSIRNQNAGVVAVNSQLNSGQGLIAVTNAALTQVSNLLTQARDILTRLADQSISTDTRAQLSTQYTNLVTTINDTLNTATYQGTNLINTSGSVGLIQDVLANQLTLAGQASTVGTVVANLSVGQAISASSAGTFLLNTFMSELNLVSSSLNTIGYTNQTLRSQVSYNTAIYNANTQGLGSLVDANLPAESARTVALQVKHRLAITSLSIVNNSSTALLSLFRFGNSQSL